MAESEQADVVIVNTCSFIASARDETIAVLHEMGAKKHAGQKLIAAGCMAESHGDLVKAVAGVDAILGTREWMRIGEVIGEQPKTTPAKNTFAIGNLIDPGSSPFVRGRDTRCVWRPCRSRRPNVVLEHDGAGGGKQAM